MNKLPLYDSLMSFEFVYILKGAFYPLDYIESLDIEPDNLFDMDTTYDSDFFVGKKVIDPYKPDDSEDVIRARDCLYLNDFSQTVNCYRVAIESKWVLVNHNIIGFDDRSSISGVKWEIDNCGINDFIEQFSSDMDSLCNNCNENHSAYFVLAFKYYSYMDYNGEYDSYSKIAGIFDFQSGTIIPIDKGFKPSDRRFISFTGKISGDCECFCWDNVPWNDCVLVKGTDLFDMDVKDTLYPNDIFEHLKCNSDTLYNFTIIVDKKITK